MASQLPNIRLSLQRVVNGVYTKEDIHLISIYLKEQDDLGLFNNSAKQVWTESMEILEDDLSQHELYKIEAKRLLNSIQNKKSNSFTFKPFMKVAATIALVISLSWAGYKVFQFNFLDKTEFVEIHIPYGSKKLVVLDDGTQVTLNAGTLFRYPTHFIGNERRVEMEGEGFFYVSKNKAKPFIIQTQDIDVKVLGTSFNVKAYKIDDQVSVSVKTGKVQVDMHEAMLRLLPNEQMVFNKRTGEIEKKLISDSLINKWISGGLYFDHTPIQSVVNDLCRIYNCEIVFADGTEFKDLISGEHDNKNLESVRQSIQFTTGINFRKEGKKIVLFKDRNNN